MIFRETLLPGVKLISPEARKDARGAFSRVFCAETFATLGLAPDVLQINTSHSISRHTLRGMHYQLGKSAETKLVGCLRGALWDVALDLRRASPTFGQYFAAELSAENKQMLYVPKGCAHGFLTLTRDVEMIYFVSSPYDPEAERCVRWDDPTFAITFPHAPAAISEKDRTAPDFDPEWHLGEVRACA
ncbi:MAG: dTDP-4-dehydrorhamnose 3,5-epimerase [Pseudomonadota bacterium]